MNSFELNKILGAILGTCLVLLALNIAAGAVFAPQKPAKPGFDIAVKEGGGEQGAAAAKEPNQPIETLLAKASVEKVRRRPSNARPATPLRRADRTALGQIFGISSAARAAKPAADSISRQR